MLFRAPAPISAIPYVDTGPRSGRNLMLLLPGRGDDALTFANEGVVQAAKRLVPKLDVIAVDATLGYYIHRNLTQRVMADVIAPAQARGYHSIFISGVSVGGLGAFLFAQQYEPIVSDIIAIAPYLGDGYIIEEIEAAGGLRQWTPSAPIRPDDYQRELWSWLKSCTEGRRTCPRIFLGFGSEDRYARGHRLLAAALPPDRVAVVAGGHTWQPWRELFGVLLPKVASALEPKEQTAGTGLPLGTRTESAPWSRSQP